MPEILIAFLLLLQVPTFELDTNECIQLHRALSLCYWSTQNFEEAQALMQESLKLSKQSPVQLAELEEHTVENALTLARESSTGKCVKSLICYKLATNLHVIVKIPECGGPQM